MWWDRNVRLLSHTHVVVQKCEAAHTHVVVEKCGAAHTRMVVQKKKSDHEAQC